MQPKITSESFAVCTAYDTLYPETSDSDEEKPQKISF